MPLSALVKRSNPHCEWRAASAWLMHSSTVCVSKYMDAWCVRAAVLGVRITQYITLVHIPAGICGHASQRVARMCLMGFDYAFQLLRACCIRRKALRLSGSSSRCDSGKVVREPVTDDQKPPTDCRHSRARVHARPRNPACLARSRLDFKIASEQNGNGRKPIKPFKNPFKSL